MALRLRGGGRTDREVLIFRGLTMSGSTHHRRDFLRSIVGTARATGDAVAPWSHRDDLHDLFADEADLLGEMHHEWLRLLVARLHHGGIVARRTPAKVQDLYAEVVAANPTLRGILDTHAANPLLREATAQEHAMLARIAGLAPDGTTRELASTIGRSLVSTRLPVQRAAS